MAVRLEPVDSEDLLGVVIDIEKAAGFRFSDDAFDFDHEVSVGEVFDRLWNRLPDQVKRGGKCPTLMVFMAVRSWFNQRDYVVCPDTRLSDIPNFDYIRLCRDLRRAGWEMLPLEIGRARLFVACAAAIIAGYALLPSGGWALPGALVSFMIVLRMTLSFDLKSDFQSHWTAADLTRQIAHNNLRRLRLNGASLHRKFLWAHVEKGCGDGKRPLKREALVV